jgi:DNA-binding GntR family transcriptional regulator
VLRTLSRNIPRNFFASVPRAAEVAVRGHQRILDALKAHDPQAAARACEMHLQEEGELVVAMMASNGFWDGQPPA